MKIQYAAINYTKLYNLFEQANFINPNNDYLVFENKIK